MGEKIILLRKQKGWSQEELGEQIGVTRQMISKWETDKVVPSYKNILALCSVFGVPIEYFSSELTEYEPEKETPAEQPAPAEEKEEGQRERHGVFFYIFLGLGIFLVGVVTAFAGFLVFRGEEGADTVTISVAQIEIVVLVPSGIVFCIMVAWLIYAIVRSKRKK